VYNNKGDTSQSVEWIIMLYKHYYILVTIKYPVILSVKNPLKCTVTLYFFWGGGGSVRIEPRSRLCCCFLLEVKGVFYPEEISAVFIKW